MKGFINNIIQAHFQTESLIRPRVRGRFESDIASQTDDSIFAESVFSQKTEDKVRQPSIPTEGIEEKTNDNFSSPKIPTIVESTDSITTNHPDSFANFDQVSPSPFLKTDDELQASHENTFQTFEEQVFPESNNFEKDFSEKESQLISPSKDDNQEFLIRNNHFIVNTESTGSLIVNDHPDLDFTPSDSQKQSRPEEDEKIGRKESSMIPKQEHLFENENGLLVGKTSLKPFQEGEADLPEPSQSLIKVSIGRIDIRAKVQSSPPPPIRKKSSPKPKLTLSDYLKKKND